MIGYRTMVAVHDDAKAEIHADDATAQVHDGVATEEGHEGDSKA